MDILTIRELKIETLIGTLPWERQIKQTVVLDLKIEIDIHSIALSDNLQHTLDYAHICSAVIQFVGQGSFRLIETLAEKIAQLLLQQFPIKTVMVEVKKPGAIKEANMVSVSIERKK